MDIVVSSEVADEVSQVIVLEPVVHAHDVHRMNEDRHVVLARFGPDDVERRVVQVRPRDVRADLAAQMTVFHRAVEFGRRCFRVLERNLRHAEKTLGVFFRECGERIVQRCGEFPVQARVERIVRHRRNDGENLYVHVLVVVHVAQAHFDVIGLFRQRVLVNPLFAEDGAFRDELLPRIACFDGDGVAETALAHVFYETLGSDMGMGVDDHRDFSLSVRE